METHQGDGRLVYSRGFVADKLIMLAGAVVAQVRPHKGDRADCFQTAYLAGLMATISAGDRPTSSDVLFLAMRTAVYRMLQKPKPLTECDLGHALYETV